MIELFGTIPALAVPVVGLGALAAGIWFGRRSARDTLAGAQRLSASTARYYVKAETTRRLVHALETPTMGMPLVELRAATATPVERLADRAAELRERIRDAVTTIDNPPDWAEGEMTLAFNLADAADVFAAPAPVAEPAPVFAELYANPSPEPRPAPVLPAPLPAPVPPIIVAPRGVQTAPRWVDGGTPPRQRPRPLVAARTRAWTGPLLGLSVPPLELPAMPRPFRMPEPRRRPDPRHLAHLPQDPTRQFRIRVVAA